MRRNIVHPGASELTYEIRGIADLANELGRLSGRPICWENIGDPVQKGERLPAWIKEIVAEVIQDDMAFAYCPTRGLPETREFLAARVNARKKAQITPNDILFFNGLGDAINKVYACAPSPGDWTFPFLSNPFLGGSGACWLDCYRLPPQSAQRLDA
jgi:alanine-synthesizing transaminase